MIEQALWEKPSRRTEIHSCNQTVFLSDAESHQGASGVWQFMKGTGEFDGLKIDKHIDESRFGKVYTTRHWTILSCFNGGLNGNWTLALAAYNCGTGTINRLSKKLVEKQIIGK
ncbi:MAG: transglycosylase SLT domain-containing protein [Saprospiraceae bacterium]|nr:transglycosylase SLT domain-containing protein [Saprospiraceae bacterium]